MSSIKPFNLKIANKLENDKNFREEFFKGQAQDVIAMQIRTLRNKRSMRQCDLADKSGMKQSAISRVEQAEYSAWTFKTLFRVANALDARLKIILEPVEAVIKEYKEMETTIEKQEATTSSDKIFTNICLTNVVSNLVNLDNYAAKEATSYYVENTPLLANRSRRLCYV